jgi:hypothetical protein
MTFAVRFRRSYGSSSALVCANSAENASGWVAWSRSARGPAKATTSSRCTRRTIESSVK